MTTIKAHCDPTSAQTRQAADTSLLQRPGSYPFQLQRVQARGFEYQHYAVLHVAQDGQIKLQLSDQQTPDDLGQASFRDVDGKLSCNEVYGHTARFRLDGLKKVNLLVRPELSDGGNGGPTGVPTGRLHVSGNIHGWEVRGRYDADTPLNPAIVRTEPKAPRNDSYVRRQEVDNCGRVVWSPRLNKNSSAWGGGQLPWVTIRMR